MHSSHNFSFLLNKPASFIQERVKSWRRSNPDSSKSERPYPVWSRISGHSSVPRVFNVTGFHQSRFLVDREKIRYLNSASLWMLRSNRSDISSGSEAHPTSKSRLKSGKRMETAWYTSGVCSDGLMISLRENGARCVTQTWSADRSWRCRPNQRASWKRTLYFPGNTVKKIESSPRYTPSNFHRGTWTVQGQLQVDSAFRDRVS
jgi:hypothetical protein